MSGSSGALVGSGKSGYMVLVVVLEVTEQPKVDEVLVEHPPRED